MASPSGSMTEHSQIGEGEISDELHGENREPNAEETSVLQKQIDSLKSEVRVKNLESEQLKGDLEVLQQQLEIFEDASLENEKISSELFLLKQETSGLLVDKKFLEEDYRNIRASLNEAEEKIKFLTAELTTVEHTRQKLEIALCDKDTEINEWKRRCEKNELEISDLKEYNRVVNEQLRQMESSTPLDKEYEFQYMHQEKLGDMTANFGVIEQENSKLLNENGKLHKMKTNLEADVKKVIMEKNEFEKQSVELNEKLTTLLERNQALMEENRVLRSRVRDNKEPNENCRHKFDSTVMSKCDSCCKELLAEEHELETKLLSLSQELHSRSRDLEHVIIVNQKYETALQDTRASLKDKITALLVMTTHCREVEKRLQETEEELRTVEDAKNSLQKDLSSLEQTAEENARKNALLEQKLAKGAKKLDTVHTQYQKYLVENRQLREQIAELSLKSGRQCRQVEDFENHFSPSPSEKPQLETVAVESHKNSTGVSNQNEDNRQLCTRLQEWIHQQDLEAEEKSRIENMLRRITNENENILTRLRSLSEELEKSQKMNDHLQTELHESKKEIKKFHNKILESIRVYNRSAENSQIEVQTVENQNICDLLKIFLQKLHSAFMEEAGSKEFEKSLQKELQQVQANNQYLQNEIQKMTSKLNNEIEENFRMKNKMRTKREENENFRGQIEKLSKQLKSIADKVSDAEKIKCTIDEKIMDFGLGEEGRKIAEQSQTDNEIQNHIDDSDPLRVRIANLVHKFNFVVTQFADLEAEKENLKDTLQKVAMENETLVLQLREWQNRYSVIAEERNQINQKAQELAEESRYIFSGVVTFSKKLKWTTNRLNYLLPTKTRIEQKFLQVEKDNENLRSQVRKCSQEYDAEVQKNGQLNNALQKLVQENESLRTLNATLLEEKNSRTEEMDNLKLLLENTNYNLQGASKSFDLLSYQIVCKLGQLREENENLETENDRILASNKEKLEFLKEVQKRVFIVAEEMECLKRLNEELQKSNIDLQEQIENHFENEIKLKNINTKLDQAVSQLENRKCLLLSQLMELSSDNKLLNSQMESLRRKLDLKEANNSGCNKLEALHSNDINGLKNDEIRLKDEMEKLHDQNKILRLEVDKLIAYVESFSDCKDRRDILLEKNAELKTVMTQKSTLHEANPTEEENHGHEKSLVELQMDRAKILEDKPQLEEKETTTRKIIQSQFGTTSSEIEINLLLLIENEELRASLKSLELDYNIVKRRLVEMEEKFHNSDPHANEDEKIDLNGTEERKQLNCQIRNGRKREEELLSQLETLNVKLVEESEHIAILQRTHAAQLQKQVEINKSLENRIQCYENREKEEKQKTEFEPASSEVDSTRMGGIDTEILMVGCLNAGNEMSDVNDAYKRIQIKQDDLQKGQVILSRKMDDLNCILSNEENDIDQLLRNNFKILKNEHQKMIQQEEEWESQFRDTLLSYDSKKCDHPAVRNSRMIEQSLVKGEHMEGTANSDGGLQKRNRQSTIISVPSEESQQSSVFAGTKMSSESENEENNSESMETREKQSKFCEETEDDDDSNCSNKVSNKALTDEIVCDEKLLDLTDYLLSDGPKHSDSSNPSSRETESSSHTNNQSAASQPDSHVSCGSHNGQEH